MSDPVLIHAGNARRAGKRYGVDPADILGILSVEGGTDTQGRPVAPRDGAGPASYGQFTFGTGRRLGVRYGDSASETNAIARYLVELGYHKDPERAIAAYNGGPGNPQYSYAKKVEARAAVYKGTGGDPPAAVPSSPSADGGGLITDQTRSGSLRALTWVALAGAGVILAGVGTVRSLGVGSS